MRYTREIDEIAKSSSIDPRPSPYITEMERLYFKNKELEEKNKELEEKNEDLKFEIYCIEMKRCPNIVRHYRYYSRCCKDTCFSLSCDPHFKRYYECRCEMNN